jgi:hypothetical protein
MASIGRTLAHYKIVAPLGAGGMGAADRRNKGPFQESVLHPRVRQSLRFEMLCYYARLVWQLPATPITQ